MKKCLTPAIESHFEFWRLHPALLKGITFLIGTSSSLFWSPLWCGIWLILCSSYLLLLNKKVDILVLFTAFAYAYFLYGNLPAGTTSGYFSITSLQPYCSPFQKGLAYQGSLYVDGKRLPCTVRYLGKTPPPANCDYVLKGTCKSQGSFQYLFKPKEWIPVKNTHSFAQMRYELKEAFRAFLNSKLHRERTASFLSALTTGDVEERLLRYEFGKVGLQHILAISGFHFALLIAFCSYFLSLFLDTKAKTWTLLAAILLYFLFVGNLPAVQRSVLMAGLYLAAKLLFRNTTGLNLLGVALLVEIIVDPLTAASLGFQLSFLSCFGILLFQPFFSAPLFRLFPKYDDTLLPPLGLHAYFLSIHLRQALLISCAVNLAIFPLLLYHFHEFPILSLLYNLFFPPLVSLALFLLLFSLLLHQVFAPLAEPFFRLTDFFTAQILDIAAYPPPLLDYSITSSHLAPWFIPLYLFALFHLTNRRKVRYDLRVYNHSGGDRSSVG